MPEHQPDAFSSLSAALAGHVAAAAPSIVGISSHRARSSGFVWKPGLIVTADEALADEGEVEAVLPGGERCPAEIAGRDPTTDIALLRVAGAKPAVAFGGSETQPGALALAVGSRAGAPLAALGAVALVGPAWRSMRGGAIDARIELGVSLRREAEGAIVLDASGRALGMAVLGPRRRVLVIPGATIDRVAAKLESHGRIPRGYLGLGLQPVRVDRDGVGAMVMSVDANGPAAKAGLRQGDVIVRWAGEPVESVQRLVRALGPETIGQTVRLDLRRAGEALEIDMTVGERPPA